MADDSQYEIRADDEQWLYTVSADSGIAIQEILSLCEQFEHDHVFEWADMPYEVLDDDGKMVGESSYSGTVINKEKNRKLIEELEEYLKEYGKPLEPNDSFRNQARLARESRDRGETTVPETFFVKIKDREVRVNSFLLGKPYAIGKNMTFLEYISERPHQLLKRSDMPEHIQEEMGKRTFGKILNALGFTGQILKAFAPKRNKSAVLFRDEVTKSQLEEDGVDVELMIKELELAHRRNNRK